VAQRAVGLRHRGQEGGPSLGLRRQRRVEVPAPLIEQLAGARLAAEGVGGRGPSEEPNQELAHGPLLRGFRGRRPGLLRRHPGLPHRSREARYQGRQDGRGRHHADAVPADELFRPIPPAVGPRAHREPVEIAHQVSG
jgi:hypothetical protein